MNQLPENSLRRYDVTSVTSYLIGLTLLVQYMYKYTELSHVNNYASSV